MRTTRNIESDIIKRTDLSCVDIIPEAFDNFFSDKTDIVNQIVKNRHDHAAIGRYMIQQWDVAADDAIKEAEDAVDDYRQQVIDEARERARDMAAA